MRLLFRSGVSARGIIYAADDAFLHSKFRAHTICQFQWQTRVKPRRLNNRQEAIGIFLHQKKLHILPDTRVRLLFRARIKSDQAASNMPAKSIGSSIVVILIVIVVYLFVDESVLIFFQENRLTRS